MAHEVAHLMVKGPFPQLQRGWKTAIASLVGYLSTYACVFPHLRGHENLLKSLLARFASYVTLWIASEPPPRGDSHHHTLCDGYMSPNSDAQQ